MWIGTISVLFWDHFSMEALMHVHVALMCVVERAAAGAEMDAESHK